MKKVVEFESELTVVSGKTKADIVTFAKELIAVLKGREEAVNNDPIIAELNAQISESKITADADAEKLKNLEADLATAKEVATEALNKFNAQATEAPKTKTVKIDGSVYEINHGINLNGKDYTAEELAADKAILKELIEMESSAVSIKGDN
jgi:uncharacterized coiled-coil protein SlyX